MTIDWLFNPKDSLPETDQAIGRGSFIDPAGNKYVCGSFKRMIDFDPSVTNLENLTSAGQEDIFIAKYDALGNYVWAKRIGGTEADIPYTITGTSGGEIIISGAFVTPVDFDPSSNTFELTPSGSEDIFIAKYDAQGNFMWARQFGNSDQDRGMSASIDSSNNVYLTGFFNGTCNFGDLSNPILLTGNNNDIFVAKFDAVGTTQWAFNLGSSGSEIPAKIVVDENNDFFLTGNFNAPVDFDPSSNTVNVSTSNGTSFFAKYNSDGQYLWAKGIGGIVHSVDVSPTQHIFLTGVFGGTVDLDPSASTGNVTSLFGGSDVFFAKYDSFGNYIWARRFGGPEDEDVNDIVVDNSDNVYLTGEFRNTVCFDPLLLATNAYSTSDGETDAYLAKFNSSGSYLWHNSFGGFSDDGTLDLCFDQDSNLFLAARLIGTTDIDPSANVVSYSAINSRGIFITYDSIGELVSSFAINNYWLSSIQGATAVNTDADNNVYILGHYSGVVDFDPSPSVANLTSIDNDSVNYTGETASYLVKYDSNGNYIWGKSLDHLVGNRIAFDQDQNPFIVGYFGGTVDFDPSSNVYNITGAFGFIDGFVSKFDTQGNFVMAFAIGGYEAESIRDVRVDASGNIIIVGTYTGTSDFDPSSNVANLTSVAYSMDFFMAKYSGTGNYIWAKSIGGPGTDWVKQMVLDESGNIICTGEFQNSADFDSSPSSAYLSSSGNYDVFLAKYDNDGNYIFAKKWGGTGDDNGEHVEIDHSGNFLITGTFSGTADFDPSASVNNLISSSSSDVFIAKYNNLGNYVWAKNIGAPLSYISSSTLCIDSLDNIHLLGSFTASVDFDPSSNSEVHTSSGGHDGFISIYDNNGNYISANVFGGILDDGGADLDIDRNGHSIIVGMFEKTIRFSETVSADTLITYNNTDAFFLKYSNCLPNLGTLSYTACDSFFCSANNQVYTQSGTYAGTATCGSAFTLDLTINHSTTGSETLTVCDSINLNGQIYNVTGIYTLNLSNASGCDSVVTLNLTILSSSESTEQITHCGPFVWTANGQTYGFSGFYTDTMTTVNGCDSILHLDIHINPVPSVNVINSGNGTLTTTSSGILEWIDCNTNAIMGSGQSFTPSQNGTYALIATDVTTTCSDTSNCIIINYLGVESLNPINYSIIPNPTNDQVHISFSGSDAELTIYDLQGKVVLKDRIQNNGIVSLQNFERGVYLFDFKNSQVHSVERVVKQ